jgi:hypothetical protein
LGTRRISYAISLGRLAAQQGPPFGTIIILNHGNNLPFPAISITNPITYTINANQYFQSMTLLDGWLVFEMINNLPIDLINFDYELVNSQAKPWSSQAPFLLFRPMERPKTVCNSTTTRFWRGS